MSEDQSSPSASDARVHEAAFGEWRVRPTLLLLRQSRASAQRMALIPPAGFAGHARLTVIAGERRDEFLHAWAEPRADGSPASASPDQPLLFSAPLADAKYPGAASADLLLEVWRGGRTSSRAPEMRTGSLRFAIAPRGAQIYLCPHLPAGPFGDGDALDAGPLDAELLDAALRALESGRRLRAALPADWLPVVLVERWEERVRALCASGRLEVLARASCDPPSLSRLRLFAAPRVAWIVDRQAAFELPRLSDAPPAMQSPSSWSSAQAATIANLLVGDDAIFASPLPRGAFHLQSGTRSLVAFRHALSVAWGADELDEGARALLQADSVMRDGMRWRSGADGEERSLAFCLVRLEEESAWKRLRRFVARWNRRHLSPQLVPATPSDYFATVEALEAAGAMRLPLVDAPGADER